MARIERRGSCRRLYSSWRERRWSPFDTGRVDNLYPDRHKLGVSFKLHYGDMVDSTNLTRLVANKS